MNKASQQNTLSPHTSGGCFDLASWKNSIRTLQKLIAIASVAVSVIRIRITPSLTPATFPYSGNATAGGGIDTQYLSIFSNVGAITSSFGPGKAKSETPEQRRQRLIRSAIRGALWRIAKMPGCREFLQEEYKDYDPAVILKNLRTFDGFQSNNLTGSGVVAQSPPAGSGSTGTPTYLSDEWFDDPSVSGWVGSLGLSRANVRTLIVLHEIKHRVGTGHDVLQDGTKRDDDYFNFGIKKHCFGVN